MYMEKLIFTGRGLMGHPTRRRGQESGINDLGSKLCWGVGRGYVIEYADVWSKWVCFSRKSLDLGLLFLLNWQTWIRFSILHEVLLILSQSGHYYFMRIVYYVQTMTLLAKIIPRFGLSLSAMSVFVPPWECLIIWKFIGTGYDTKWMSYIVDSRSITLNILSSKCLTPLP